MNEEMKGRLRSVRRPARTREGVFLLAVVLAGAGLALAISGRPIAFTVVLLVASAAVLAGGIVAEVVAFLSPGPDRLRHHTAAGVETDRNPDAPSNGKKLDGTR
jgi:hypothetical protein